MRASPALLLVLFCVVLAGCASQAPALSSRPASLAPAEVDDLLREGLAAGVGVAVIDDGRVAAEHGFGAANVETGAPVTPSTIFEAASLSKVVFSYGVLKLVAERRLDLDAPVGRYLPPASVDPKVAALTVRRLLTHTSGLPNDGGLKLSEREGFSYSGEGFTLLQRVVEAVTGEPLDAYMRRAVFEPLGMTSSSFTWSARSAERKAFAHTVTGSLAGRDRVPDARARSSLDTTAGDYARFLTAWLKGEGLPPALRDEMLRPQAWVDETCQVCVGRPVGARSRTLAWGLGVGLAVEPGTTWAWHWGDNGNTKAYFAVDAGARRGVVILSNSANGLAVAPVIAESVLGRPAPGFEWLRDYERYDTPARRLLRASVDQGERALEGATLADTDIRRVAQQLADGRRPREAAAAYRRLLQTSGSAADRAALANALRRAGDVAGAKREAEAALAQDPSSRTAALVLQRVAMQERRVPPALLAAYAGTYASPFGDIVIAAESGRLVGRFEDQPETALLPMTDREFFVESIGLPFEFVAGPDGAVTHALAKTNGGAIRLERKP